MKVSKFGFGTIEVKSMQKSEIHIEITGDFPEVKASTTKDLRNKILAKIDGNPSSAAMKKLESYYKRFDNLIGVKRGKIYLVPIEALSPLPLTVYRFGNKDKNPNELRSAFGFSVSIPDCVFLGTIGEAAERINQKVSKNGDVSDKWILPGEPFVTKYVLFGIDFVVKKDLESFLEENKVPRNKITWKYLAENWNERKTLRMLEDHVRQELRSINELAMKGLDAQGYGIPRKWQLSEDQIESIVKRSLEEYVIPQYIEDAFSFDFPPMG